MATIKPIKIFVSYAHEDEVYLDGICTILKPLELNEEIAIWTDRHILPSKDWHKEIVKNLSGAHVILLLVSPDFLASEYITHTEIKNILDRHVKNDDVHVVQVLVRPVLLNLLPFGNLQSIPTGTKPVSKWPTIDEAWNDVLKHVQQLLDSILAEPTAPQEPTPPAPTPKAANFTDKIVKLLFVLLIAISIGVFFFGMLGGGHGDDRLFYSLTSLAGMGSGFGGYTMVRRWS